MVFNYHFLYRILYQFGNIPATLAILFYLLNVLQPGKTIHQLYAGIILIILLVVNRYFMYLYRIIPYQIEIRNGEIIASKFFLSKKEVRFRPEMIKKIEGGIFDARYGSLIKIYTGKAKPEIAFFLKMNNSRELQDFLLRNIDKRLYNAIVEKLGINSKHKNKK